MWSEGGWPSREPCYGSQAWPGVASNPAVHPRPPSLPRFSWNILGRSGCLDTHSRVQAQMLNKAHKPSRPWSYQLTSGDYSGLPSCDMMAAERGL